MTILAQIQEAVGTLDALKPYGIAGVCVAFFMARDVWKDWRDSKHEDQRNAARDALWLKVEEALNRNTTALGYLIRATTAEVQSRPHVHERVLNEMEEIDRAMAKR